MIANLKVGDKIRCKRGIDGHPPEVLEVLKLYADGRVLLCTDNGNCVKVYAVPFTIETLEAYDYEIVMVACPG